AFTSTSGPCLGQRRLRWRTDWLWNCDAKGTRCGRIDPDPDLQRWVVNGVGGFTVIPVVDLGYACDKTTAHEAYYYPRTSCSVLYALRNRTGQRWRVRELDRSGSERMEYQ